ncbi:MAG: (E)-4-hydroxy-3-methylbut-2-enyl-diphosphate synthase [Bdellovibrionales bacterium]|nr:(E)-4-hydroxy-3-methylbut-2-enyl-diphosphate synthase [Bdellovibrionales bacterium]
MRRETREVKIGDVTVGGNNPIVVQSMTTTPTTDTQATVKQIAALIEVGCQVVRITVPTKADMDNIPNIREEMKRLNLKVPLVADIHFLPQLALRAVDWFEKVRINPGNFADRKNFEVREYTEIEYQRELDRIREAFLPILRRAKTNGVSIRVGTNHGSLSDRIMNRYGDTPMGMVESALEFIRIAEDEGFHHLIISMKASNVQVMIQAYRLLVARMNELNMKYPLHLGVTEAGDGEDGRIKSAIGIGSLLADGLGDTIRVSLTEDPEFEIPVAKNLVQLFERPFKAETSLPVLVPSWDFYSYQRREVDVVKKSKQHLGGREQVRVVTHLNSEVTQAVNQKFDPVLETVSIPFQPNIAEKILRYIPDTIGKILRIEGAALSDLQSTQLDFEEISVLATPVWTEDSYLDKIVSRLKDKVLWLRINREDQIPIVVEVVKKFYGKMSVGVEIESNYLMSLGRIVSSKLSKAKLLVPLHLHLKANSKETKEQWVLRASVEIGSLLCDGLGDSIELSSRFSEMENHILSFNILQATRLRMSKTDYIACPSCGRTLFDLQETTAKIRKQTSHLKGVKIAIMGCIVNGPGEMADADFGYVGSGPGHINLYVGKDCVERHIPQIEAVDKLVELIKSHGRWIEPTL